MIRIEDAEDFEAYKEAKAELDDEFREAEDDLPKEEAKEDSKVKRGDIIDWQANDSLNAATKMAIAQF